MGLHNRRHIHSSFLLKIVNVLSGILPQHSFILQKLDKVMCWSRVVLRQIEMLRKPVKWFRLFKEEIYSKDAFRLRQIVLLEVVIDARTW